MSSEQESNDQKVYGNEPELIKCPYCGIKTMTSIEFINGYNSYLLSLVIVLVLGIGVSILIAPLAYILSKTLIHRCSVCFQELGTNGYIFFGLGIKEKISSFQLGEFGCIMSRSILIGVILTLMTILLLYFNIGYDIFKHLNQQNLIFPIKDTWEDFLTKCNRDQVMHNQTAFMKCQQRYSDRTVINWSGYVIRVEDNRDNFYRFLSHAITILIKMEPTESELHPDLLIQFDSELSKQLSSTFDSISRGQKVLFNGTMKSIGGQDTARHLHGLNITLQEEYKNIEPYVQENSRYYKIRKNKNKNFQKEDIENVIVEEAEKEEQNNQTSQN